MPIETDWKPIVLNQSRLKTYNLCRRLFGWQYIQNLRPAMQRSAPSIGIAVHAALAEYHSGESVEKSVETLRKSVEKSAGPTTVFEDKTVAESGAIGEDVFRAYVVHYTGSDEIWEPLNQEIEFLVEVGQGRKIFLRGRADNLSFVKGALYLVDYKTAGKMDPRALLKYELDTQLSCYIYGLSKYLTQQSQAEGGPPIRVEGAIIDLLVKTKMPQFARESYTRSDEELAEFESEFIEYAEEIRARLTRVADGEDWKKVFPKNTEACFQYGTCAYRDLCLRDNPVRRAAYARRSPDYVDSAQAELLK
jgi:hypothetical protein